MVAQLGLDRWGILEILTPGVSQEAKDFENQIHRPVTFDPISFSSPFSALIDELDDLVAECGEDNWDGYDAKGTDLLAVKRAERFFRVLPSDLPTPDLMAMPNGDVALDWDFAPRRTITVSIGAGPRLAYAAIDGDEEWSGTVSFSDTVPGRIVEAIRTLSRR